ncbi:MAG: hypothetical protein GMKNLPBB_02324 [Myxococcota bacterium]|nr:hypothetical protein [Myxococcota bacterium]
MKLKQLWMVALAAVVAAGMTACGGDTTATDTDSPGTPTDAGGAKDTGGGGTPDTGGGGTDAAAPDSTTGDTGGGDTGPKPECEIDDDCQPGFVCKEAQCVKLCSADSDCKAGEICNVVTGECAPPLCSTDNECGAGKCCELGKCGECPKPAPASCEVVTPDGVITEGAERQYSAVAFGGDSAVGRVEFEWSSSDTGVASIDAKGLAKGGSKAGTTDIKAKIKGGADCKNVSKLTNPGKPAAGVKVVVRSEIGGKPVANADVVVGTAKGKTDANGVAEIAGGKPGDDVHVFAADYAYVSVLGGSASDLVVVHLPANDVMSQTGGMRGNMDYSKAKNPQNELKLAIVGVSIGGNLVDLNLNMLLGSSIPTPLACSTFGLNDTVDLPGALVFEAQGFCEKAKGEFFVEGAPGRRVGWAVGGTVALSEVTKLIDVLGPVLGGGGGGDLPIGTILAAVLPLFANFSHAIESDLLVQHAPLKAGKPDYDNATAFPKRTAKLTAPLGLNVKMKLAKLPTLGGKPVSGALVLVGAQDKDLGMVPLGLGAALDSPEQGVPGDGVISPPKGNKSLKDGELGLNIAPQHGGIVNRPYGYIVLAAPIDAIGGSSGFNISGLVRWSDKVEREVDLSSSNFLGFGEGSAYDPASRKFTLKEGSGSSLVRVAFGDNDKSWVFYAAKGTASITVPDAKALGVEARGTDKADKWNVESLKVKGDPAPGKLIDLKNSQNLDDLNTDLEGFSVYQSPAKK